MVPIKGRAKVKLFDVIVLCRLAYVKQAFRNCTREQQAGFSKMHARPLLRFTLNCEHAHCGFDVLTPKHFFDK